MKTPYMTAPEAAARWGCSVERVYQLLQGDRVAGAIKPGRDWLIPSGAKKPDDRARGRPKRKP